MSDTVCHEPPPTSGKDAPTPPDKPGKSVHFSNLNKKDNLLQREVNGCEKVEAKTAPKNDTTNNRDNRSLTVVNRRPADSIHIKGTCAKFLRQNPRFINESVCHVLPNEYSASVGECMSWSSSSDSVSTVGTTIHDRYKPEVKSSQGHPIKS